MVTHGSFTAIPTIHSVIQWNVLVVIHEMEQLGGCLHADANSSVSKAMVV